MPTDEEEEVPWWKKIAKIMLLLLPFYAFLGYLVYRGMQSGVLFLQILMPIVGLGVGGGVLYGTVQKAREDSGSGSEPEHPWEARDEWAEGRITTTGGSLGGLGKEWFFVIFGVVFLAIGASITVFLLMKGSEKFWFGLPFAIPGALLMIQGGYPILRRWQFGETVFEMDTVPGALGGPLCGVIHTGIPAEKAPDDGFHVTIACYRQSYAEEGVSHRVQWRDEKQVEGRLSADGTTMDVPVAVELPSDQPASTPEKESSRVRWTVEVSADLAGIDYSAVLEIPVFPVEPDPSVSVDQYAQRKDDEEWDEPMSAGIDLRRSSGRLELDVGRGRNLWLTLLGAVPALGGFLGSAFFFSMGKPVGVIPLIIGLGFGAGAYYYGTYRSRVVVDRDGIAVRSGVLGYESTMRFSCSELKEARLEPKNHWYDLHLVRESSLDPETPEDEDADGAWAAARAKVKADGDYSWETVEVAARMLSNHREAEWIAEQIEEVAARQARYE